MVLEELRKLSVNDLLARLHAAVSSTAQNVTKLTERNREITLVDIIEIRNHIKQRLEGGDEVAENTRLLKLIALFKDDKNALELMKIDFNEWLEFLDAVKDHLEQKGGALTPEEARELDKLKTDINHLQGILRKP